jgi:hypothetical protein
MLIFTSFFPSSLIYYLFYKETNENNEIPLEFKNLIKGLNLAQNSIANVK